MNTSPQDPVRASASTSSASADTNLKRRRFLFAIGAGGAGAAAVVAQPLAAQVTEQAGVAADAAKGYRETEHVRDYYATTRI